MTHNCHKLFAPSNQQHLTLMKSAYLKYQCLQTLKVTPSATHKVINAKMTLRLLLIKAHLSLPQVNVEEKVVYGFLGSTWLRILRF